MKPPRGPKRTQERGVASSSNPKHLMTPPHQPPPPREEEEEAAMVAELPPPPSRDLALVSTALSGISLIALAYADWSAAIAVPSRAVVAEGEFSKEKIMFLVGVSTLTWATPLAHLYGVQVFPEDRPRPWRLWQPFSGGAGTIVLQIFGWGIFAVALLLGLITLLNPEKFETKFIGVKTAIGALGLVSNVLIRFSVTVYDDTAAAAEENEDDVVVKAGSRSPYTITAPPHHTRMKTLAKVFVSLTLLLVSVYRDFSFPSNDDDSSSALASAAQAEDDQFRLRVAGFLATVVLGRHVRNRWSEKILAAAASSSTASQIYFLTTFFSLFMLGAMAWIALRLHHNPELYLVGSTSTTTFVGLVAYFIADASVVDPYTLRRGEEESERTIPPSSSSLASRKRRVPLNDSPAYTLSVVLLPVTASLFAFPNLPPGSRLAALLLSLLACPLSHVGAYMQLGGSTGYRLFQPLRGGLLFTTLQGVGWMWFSLTLAAMAVSWREPDLSAEEIADFAYPIALLAHVSITVSKLTFNADVDFSSSSSSTGREVAHSSGSFSLRGAAPSLSLPPPSHPSISPSPPPLRAAAPSLVGTARGKSRTNSFSSTTTTITCATLPLHRLLLAYCALALALTACVWTVTISPPNPAYEDFALLPERVAPYVYALVAFACHVGVGKFAGPFAGGPTFVLNQVLGWTIFSLAALFQFILLVPGRALGTSPPFSFESKQDDLLGGGWMPFLAASYASHFVSAFILWNSPRYYEASPPSPESSSSINPAYPSSPQAIRMRKENVELTAIQTELERLEKMTLLPRAREELRNVSRRLEEELKARRRARTRQVNALGVVVIAMTQLSLAAYLAAEIAPRAVAGPRVTIGFFFSVSAASLTVLISYLKHGPEGLKPFEGGLHHVMLQFAGWFLFAAHFLMQLMMWVYRVERVARGGVVLSVGLVAYVSLICLGLSLTRFTPGAPHLGHAFHHASLGLSLLALLAFVTVDAAVVKVIALEGDSERGAARDGRMDLFLAPVVIIGWLSVFMSVPVYYWFLAERRRRLAPEEARTADGSVSFVAIVSVCIWTFSLLLGLLLVTKFLTSSSPDGGAAAVAKEAWSYTSAGGVSLLANVLLTLGGGSTKTQSLATAVGLAGALITIGFLYVIMPAVRWLLDYPMWYYAYYFKTWGHSLAPDGRRVMEGCIITRDIPYGRNVLDVISPTGDVVTATREKKQLSSESPHHPPILWLHGGGHLFCKREVLVHSVTPLARVGVVVYAVEYPLAPEARFPEPVLAVLEAVAWVGRNHCRHGGCYTGKFPPSVCETCSSTTKAEAVEGGGGGGRGKCRCCVHNRGAPTVQLLGDSAGGGLASMAAALLTNPHLLREIPGAESLGPFPHLQRLSLLYGLLGREKNLLDEGDSSWFSWAVNEAGSSVIRFCLEQYAPLPGKTATTTTSDRTNDHVNGNNSNGNAMASRLTFNDLGTDLKDFCPETLIVVGRADPLLRANRLAMDLIRKQTGRECRIMEFEHSTHAFHGLPPQWTFGAWERDAYPATLELMRFHTGGEAQIEPITDFAALPKDYSQYIVFPLTLFFVGLVMKIAMMDVLLAVFNLVASVVSQ